ncbi:MAG: radical SAM protein [Acidobacteria bacterium]|nr:MAG: radical SAM protein [Acidobacteriota bacterium]
MHASAHLFGERHVLIPNGNRIYELDAEAFASIANASNDAEIDAILVSLGIDAPPFVDDTPLVDPPLRAISLAVAQKCNLGCTYCYAQQGDFGGAAKNMPLATALKSIDLLFADVAEGEKVNVAFLGGEPLINRAVLRLATGYASQRARETGAMATFSITTNGTLLTEEDAEFFEANGFAVTVSIDGIGAAHDAQRPFKNGRGSFDALMSRVEPLLRMQRRMQVSARVTVTPRNLALRETLDELLARGFHSVGFSPMLTAPTHDSEMHARDLERMLAAMIECGDEFRRRTRAGERYAFANLVNALREIHRGTHRPYPCGAGASYLGVSADGELAACHRFVGDEAGAMGDLENGVDSERQSRWLAERHVARQEPCRSCWARYMCGGGCHHEEIHRGRPACDYIRGWLHYCLETYAELGCPA